jgi:putative acetyltransferase
VFLVLTTSGLGWQPEQAQTPLACVALRPLSATVAEVKRMFVTASARRQGVARALLRELEARARELGFVSLQLETGYKQSAAMALYIREGYVSIEPYGEHVGDPTSRCFAKRLEGHAQGKS